MEIRNRDWLTYAEWYAAAHVAGIPLTRGEVARYQRAWLAGEDPAEYAAEQGTCGECGNPWPCESAKAKGKR